MRGWVDSWLAKTRVGDPALRLHLAILLRRMQLVAAYRPYLAYFGGMEAAVIWYCLQRASDEGLLNENLTDKLPPRDFLESAMRMAAELNDLQELIHRGPLQGVQDRLPESFSHLLSPEGQAAAEIAPDEEQAIKSRALAALDRFCQEVKLLEQIGGGGNNVNNELATFPALLTAQSAV